MSSSRAVLGRILLAMAFLIGMVSFWFTIQFTWTPEFSAPELPIPTHTNYHAFREALLALAVNLLILRVGIKGLSMHFEVCATTLFVAAFYYLGWLEGPH